MSGLPPPGRVLRVLAGSALSLAVVGAAATLTRQPWLFPSLGPGLLCTPTQPAVALAAVVLVTVVDWLYGRLTAHPMPLWAAADPSPQGAQDG